MTAIETILSDCLAELDYDAEQRKIQNQNELEQQTQDSNRKILEMRLNILNTIKDSYEQHEITLPELNRILEKI